MAKDLNPKCKQCRRAGEKLFLKGDRCKTTKCAMVKRNYPPGFHGPKGKKRITDYGMQLNEKQKARKQYCLLEKQFRLTFEKALKKSGNTAENFLRLLEQRFDNVIYRAGIADSRSQARQLIGHGLLTINDRKVTIPSYLVKTGNLIKIKDNKKNIKLFKDFQEKLKKQEIPGWLHLDVNEQSIKVLHEPKSESLKPSFNIQMIVEYYSR